MATLGRDRQRTVRAAVVACYADDGERAIAALRTREPTSLFVWPGVAGMTTWVEALIEAASGRSPTSPFPVLR
ncbi:MAG: hypothetical protein JO272_15980 [Pseudonocardiales bacterium]|nr:hypothetical protein [Pseudonocardiales bacterium]